MPTEQLIPLNLFHSLSFEGNSCNHLWFLILASAASFLMSIIVEQLLYLCYELLPLKQQSIKTLLLTTKVKTPLFLISLHEDILLSPHLQTRDQ